MKGDTGPLVYPAGFLYVYSAIQYVTGGQVFPAQVILVLSQIEFSCLWSVLYLCLLPFCFWLQILFGILYIINLGIVLLIYVKTDVVWNLLLFTVQALIYGYFCFLLLISYMIWYVKFVKLINIFLCLSALKVRN